MSKANPLFVVKNDSNVVYQARNILEAILFKLGIDKKLIQKFWNTVLDIVYAIPTPKEAWDFLKRVIELYLKILERINLASQMV